MDHFGWIVWFPSIAVFLVQFLVKNWGQIYLGSGRNYFFVQIRFPHFCFCCWICSWGISHEFEGEWTFAPPFLDLDFSTLAKLFSQNLKVSRYWKMKDFFSCYFYGNAIWYHFPFSSSRNSTHFLHSHFLLDDWCLQFSCY